MFESETLKDCNKSILLNPRNISAYKKRGVIKADMGNIKEAVEDYNKVILISPNDISAYFTRATLKADLGDFEGAKKDFDTANNLNKRLHS
jgi:tetratricopeptide (TPR) repeat protein